LSRHGFVKNLLKVSSREKVAVVNRTNPSRLNNVWNLTLPIHFSIPERVFTIAIELNIPYQVQQWLAACQYPTKSLEYVASRLPIVSTPVKDVVDLHGDVVEIAASPEEFIAACERVLGMSSEAIRKRVRLISKRAAVEDIVERDGREHADAAQADHRWPGTGTGEEVGFLNGAFPWALPVMPAGTLRKAEMRDAVRPACAICQTNWHAACSTKATTGSRHDCGTCRPCLAESRSTKAMVARPLGCKPVRAGASTR
jgi:hypothetical protein